MEKFVIEGGRPLYGNIRIQGAKNAALPILAAATLTDGISVIEDVPDLLDIRVMLEILTSLGCEVRHDGNLVKINTATMFSSHIPEDLMGQMRSSVFLMGPLLAKFGEVKVYRPGGCAIGERPIDLHLKGLQKMGAIIEESHSLITCKAEKLFGAEIMLDLPSVGATENLMMAAALADGHTIIRNAAREPEITDLQNFINAMGGSVSGAGSDTIHIDGVERLSPVRYRVIPDRIVAGTLMIATAMTKGEISIHNVIFDHIAAIALVLREMGVQIKADDDIIKISYLEPLKKIDKITTSYFPSFPTDMQPQMMALLAITDGSSMIKETIFNGRFKHVSELNRMGANIKTDLNTAFIQGVPKLSGASVEATDLRAGAAMVLAGLVAEGTTQVKKIHYIDRGYDRFDKTLQELGAKIERVKDF